MTGNVIVLCGLGNASPREKKDVKSGECIPTYLEG